VAQYGADSEVVYNLGLSYLKVDNPPMALSMFLSLPKNAQNSREFLAALRESLSLTGHQFDDLDMGAHGLITVAVTLAKTVDKLHLQALTSVSLPIVVGLIYVKIAKLSFLLKRPNLNFYVNLALGSTALITSVAFFVMALSTFYSSNWCSVVGQESATIHSTPSAESPVVRTLTPGTPILVLGSLKRPYLYSLESKGARGWIDSLQVRCVVGKK